MTAIENYDSWVSEVIGEMEPMAPLAKPVKPVMHVALAKPVMPVALAKPVKHVMPVALAKPVALLAKPVKPVMLPAGPIWRLYWRPALVRDCNNIVITWVPMWCFVRPPVF